MSDSGTLDSLGLSKRHHSLWNEIARFSEGEFWHVEMNLTEARWKFSFSLHLFVFTHGEVTDILRVMKEAQGNSKKHRYKKNVIVVVVTGPMQYLMTCSAP